mmetsp:Transcript_57968/g.126053  ORF Transcript_57968/g.126053 Transcript_57968/m.126053 type:complete len:415 (-) Transcript_57968:403-1647(-)
MMLSGTPTSSGSSSSFATPKASSAKTTPKHKPKYARPQPVDAPHSFSPTHTDPTEGLAPKQSHLLLPKPRRNSPPKIRSATSPTRPSRADEPTTLVRISAAPAQRAFCSGNVVAPIGQDTNQEPELKIVQKLQHELMLPTKNRGSVLKLIRQLVDLLTESEETKQVTLAGVERESGSTAVPAAEAAAAGREAELKRALVLAHAESETLRAQLDALQSQHATLEQQTARRSSVTDPADPLDNAEASGGMPSVTRRVDAASALWAIGTGQRPQHDSDSEADEEHERDFEGELRAAHETLVAAQTEAQRYRDDLCMAKSSARLQQKRLIEARSEMDNTKRDMEQMSDEMAQAQEQIRTYSLELQAANKLTSELKVKMRQLRGQNEGLHIELKTVTAQYEKQSKLVAVVLGKSSDESN